MAFIKMLELITTIESVVLVTLVSMVILLMFRKTRTSRYLQLPGPRGIPFFGNFLQLDRMNMHLTFDKWRAKYGGMFRFKVLGQNILVINSSEIARELFSREPMATLTAGRMPTFFSKYMVDDADVVLCPYSDESIYRRKKSHQLLGAYGDGLREIEDQLTTILDEVGHKMKKSQNRVVDPSEYINGYLLENLEVLISGGRGNKELQEYMLEMDHTTNIILNPGIDRILMTFPMLRHIPGYFSDLVNRCLTSRNAMMDILHNIHENKSAYGFLTTNGSLMSILRILMSKPEVQTKLQVEIAEVIGVNRHPLLRDREKCHYTEAIILESLRYISHVPIVYHYTIGEFEFRDITVPKDCTIFLNTWSIHHNEKEFEDPFQFKPERFLDDDGKLQPATNPQRQRLLAFGTGKRSCIGEVFARSRIFLFLAHVLQHFTVTPATGKAIPLFHPTDMKPGFALQSMDFKCKFIPICNDFE